MHEGFCHLNIILMKIFSYITIFVQNIDTATQLKYEELKQEVRRMFKVPMDESFHKLHLIDTIKRLGVSYHFEREIEDALQNIYDHDYKDEESLEATALRFRLLRENGFNVLCGESNLLFYYALLNKEI